MAGRPPLRIGQHGKISRKHIGGEYGKPSAATGTQTESPDGCGASALRTNMIAMASSLRMR